MAQPTSICPPDEWREWMLSLWDEHFPGILTNTFEWQANEVAGHILNISEESKKSFLDRLQPGSWERIAQIALTTPRAHITAAPLDKAERQTCHEAVYKALYYDGLGDSLETC